MSTPLPVDEFVASYGDGYQLVTLDTEQAHLHFAGPYQGQTVVWEARVCTLTRRCRDNAASSLRNSIEVRVDALGGHQIDIVLDIAAINPTTLLMTMKMVRQWRRLGPGRHEYGTPRRRHETDTN